MWDFEKEVERKLIHLTVAVLVLAVIVVALDQIGKQATLFCLVFILIIFLIVDFLRVELGKKIPFLHPLWRRKEENRFGGQIFFILGSIVAFSVFDLNIAIAAVLMASFGDFTAALVGRFGKFWITKERSVEGILAELVVNLIIGFIVVGNLQITLIMALVATLVESLVNELDDNLFIPVFAGFAGQLASYLSR